MNDSGPSISDPHHATHSQRLIRDRDEQRHKDLLKQDNKPLEQCAALQSALFSACHRGLRDRVLDLIQKNADINDCNNFGATPLHIAVSQNHDGVVEELLNAGVNYAAWNRERQACYGDEDVMRELPCQQVDLYAADSSGHYAIHVACKKGHLNIVALLIKEHSPQSRCGVLKSEVEKGTKPEVPQYHVDVEDKNGWTPLHYACTSFAPNYEQVVHWLLKRGADLMKQTPDGKTALHLTFERGRDELFRVRINGCF